MKDLKNIYRYRYDAKMGIWEKILLQNVLVSGTLDAYRLSNTQNRDAYLTLRVMTGEDVDVLPEDLIAFSEESLDVPPKMSAVVVSVTKNLRGTKFVQHTKILCR